MVAEINVLQIGGDWSKDCRIPNNVKWITKAELDSKNDIVHDEKKRMEFDVILISNFEKENLRYFLEKYAKPYTILYSKDNLITDKKMLNLLKRKVAVKLSLENPQKLIDEISSSFFRGQSGIRIKVNDIELAPNFLGDIDYLGFKKIKLTGKFGEKMTPILSWKRNIYVDPGKKLEFWLEYEKSDSVELELTFRQSLAGSTDIKQKSWIINEDTLKRAFVIENTDNSDREVFLSVSLSAKGKGILSIGNLHSRWTRFEFGKSLVGGKIVADTSRQEFMYYFNPGDMKPPLNVYFSGYRPLEGFEGYWMMQKFGAPFLLFTDPRNEGGAFYVGSKDYEQKIEKVILSTLNKLGFQKEQLIISGMSMGAFGAIYYGARISPRAIILGKPLINLGNIAKNGRIQRPGEFDTALDLLLDQEGKNSKEAANKLNDKVWNMLSGADFSKTTIAAAYMKNDDYDDQAFKQIVEYFGKKGTKIIGKGWVGRHNDNSSAIVNWFVTQYIFFLEKIFGRIDSD